MDGTEVVLVRIGVVAMDFKDLGNESSAGPSFELDNNIY